MYGLYNLQFQFPSALYWLSVATDAGDLIICYLFFIVLKSQVIKLRVVQHTIEVTFLTTQVRLQWATSFPCFLKVRESAGGIVA